jgi:DedD protein
MAERIADNAEQIVDEMKRKARRRLVGAVVLALGAAIVLPLLLEKEPRPLGDDVSVRIPPVDESKFVNRLTGKTGDIKALPKAETRVIVAAPGKSDVTPDVPAELAPASPPAPPPAAASEAKNVVTEGEQRVLAPSPISAPKADTKVTAAPTPSSETKPAAKTETNSAAKAETKAAPATESSSDPKPALAAVNPAPASASASASEAASTPSVVAPAKADGFVVQLAAFADDKGANALANKLKRSGYAAYVQPVETSRGTLWRVRVGGYASKPEADAARVTLKGEGYNGITAPAQ